MIFQGKQLFTCFFKQQNWYQLHNNQWSFHREEVKFLRISVVFYLFLLLWFYLLKTKFYLIPPFHTKLRRKIPLCAIKDPICITQSALQLHFWFFLKKKKKKKKVCGFFEGVGVFFVCLLWGGRCCRFYFNLVISIYRCSEEKLCLS